MILDRSGRPDLDENLDVGPSCSMFISICEKLKLEETNHDDIVSRQSLSHKILKMTIESFHDFGKKSTWSLYLRITIRFSVFSYLGFLLVKV